MRLPRRKIVEAKCLGGEVTVRVRRPTWNEAQETKVAFEASAQEELRKLLAARIVGIEGLEMDEVGPITTIEQAFDLLDVDTLGEILQAAGAAGRPTGEEVGESSPQPSGAASTGPGTAVIVDAGD